MLLIFFLGGRGKNWGWCSGALNKAAFPLPPSLDALLLLWGSLSCKHKSSTSKAKDKSPAKSSTSKAKDKSPAKSSTWVMMGDV